jgi:hypothetical protein
MFQNKLNDIGDNVRKSLALLINLIIFSGCAINSGIVPMGQETYMVSRQAATGFTGMGSLKAEAFKEANEYCISQNRKIQVIKTIESSPPYILGNFPRVEIQFMCLCEGDVELSRPKLKKEADLSIEKTADISIDAAIKSQSEDRSDLYSELLKLEDLKKKGIINEDEFKAQKEKLLRGK